MLMGEYINVWNKKPKKQIYSILKELGLENTFSNYRTSIWENEDVHISVDRKVIRILSYEGRNDSVRKMMDKL